MQLHERLPTPAPGDEDRWPAPPESVVRIGAPEVGGGRNLGQGDRRGDLPIGDVAHVRVGNEAMRRFRIRRGEKADDLDPSDVLQDWEESRCEEPSVAKVVAP